LAEMIRYRACLIAAGYPDGNDCDALKSEIDLECEADNGRTSANWLSKRRDG